MKTITIELFDGNEITGEVTKVVKQDGQTMYDCREENGMTFGVTISDED